MFVALSFADTLTMPSIQNVRIRPISSRVSRCTSVNVEGNLNLRNTLRCGWDANQIEVSKKLVILYKFTFALENCQLDSSLARSG